MLQNPSNISTDLRGLGTLTIEAISGITDIVESMHHTIGSLAGIFGTPDQNRTNAITGMVYRNIHAITELVGDGIDTLLDQFGSIMGETNSIPGREIIVSSLNGILGDHLVARNNPLAITMELRRDGKAMDKEELINTIKNSNGKIVIMVHGLCMNDLQWNSNGHDHGAALAEELGFVPIYLHYNTGLHVSENGRNFADILEAFIKTVAEISVGAIHELPLHLQKKTGADDTPNGKFPDSIELFIIAHSMGGLVSRSACHYGKESDHTWLNNLKKIIFLGTPHHGAPLAKGGIWLDNLLEINPYSAPFARLGKIRSCGLTDLRYGNVLDEDWKGRDRFELSDDNRGAVPLPEGVECYSIAATTCQDSGKICSEFIGDGLVTLDSAFGIHKDPKYNLMFLDKNKFIAPDVNHMDFLNDRDVYQTIKSWLVHSQD